MQNDFGVFLTLTYPQWYPSPKRAKDHLRAFLERLRRKLPDNKIWAVWKIEPQQRGAPHFHLMIFGLPFISKETIANWWAEVLQVVENPFTRIEAMSSRNQTLHYVSKYVSKDADFSGFNPPTKPHALKSLLSNLAILGQLKTAHILMAHIALLMRPEYSWSETDDPLPGRFWGVFNGDNRVWHTKIVRTIPIDDQNYKVFHTFRRAARRKWSRVGDRMLQGFSLFSDDVEQWLELFETIYTDVHNRSMGNNSKRDLTSYKNFPTH